MRPNKKKESHGKRRSSSNSGRYSRESQGADAPNTSTQPANMPPASVQVLKTTRTKAQLGEQASESGLSGDEDCEEGSPECAARPTTSAVTADADALQVSESRIRCRRNAIDPSTYVHPFPPPDNGT